MVYEFVTSKYSSTDIITSAIRTEFFNAGD